MSLLRRAAVKPTAKRSKSRVGALTVISGSENGRAAVRKFIGDPFDRFLAGRGLVKKLMPCDNDSSVFRAVCESLRWNQNEAANLQAFVDEYLLFQYHVERIVTGLARVDRVKDILKTIAFLLNVDLHVYHRIGAEPVVYKASSSGEAAKKVMLCETTRGHFDLVMTIEDHINLGHAQTLIYQILYIDVFKFLPEDIKDSVKRVRMDMDTVGDDVPTPASDDLLQSSFESSSSRSEGSGPAAIRAWRPPIPYSSVKSLDPSVYRNLSYDVFLRRRRREGDNGSVFTIGTQCLFMNGNSVHYAYVKAVPDQNSRIVLTNGKERKVYVWELVPIPRLKRSQRKNDVPNWLQTYQRNDGVAQSSLPALWVPDGFQSAQPYAYQYNYFESLVWKYDYPVYVRASGTPSWNNVAASFPTMYYIPPSAPQNRGARYVPVATANMPMYSSFEYMYAAYCYEYGSTAVAPYFRALL